MATQPAVRHRKRRPVGGEHVRAPLGPRALRVGLRTTLLAPLGAAASVVLVADGDRPLGSFGPLLFAIVVVGVFVTLLPWDRLAGTTSGRRILYGWAALDILLITLAGWSTGGSDVALPLGYAVTIVFFAVVLRSSAQIVFLGSLLACYGAVLVAHDFQPLPLLMLGVLGVLACFLSREARRRIDAHDRARVESERRWAVAGTVSKVARDVTATHPNRVLEGVVEAVVALGYEAAAIHVRNGDGEMQTVLPASTSDEVSRAMQTLPDSIRTEVLEGGRDVVLTTKGADRNTGRALRAAGLETVAATPLVVGDRPEGVLIVGRAEPDAITSQELDAFAMLAAPAAMAISNLRRAEEQQAVADRLVDAERLQGDVIARLSQELRAPLAAVIEASRRLQDTADQDGDDDRRKMIDRLAADAVALDVAVGGSLDYSLLESGRLELQAGEVDLGGVVSDVVDRLAGLFRDRELRVSAQKGLMVEADPALIARAIEALLVNAATTTPAGGIVEVALSRGGDQTTLKVAAGGNGIPADRLGKLGKATGGEGEIGPGLGLALAWKILDLHGTELQARTEPRQGTKFWFTLPGNREARAGAIPPMPAAAAAEVEGAQVAAANAMLPAIAASAAIAVPPPPVEEEEPHPGRFGAAAAAVATAASGLVVTGLIPDLLQQPDPAAVTAPDPRNGGQASTKGDRSKDKGDRTDEDGGSGGSTTGGTSGDGIPSASTGDTTTGGTTDGGTTDGGTTDGTGGGSGDGSGGGSGDGTDEDPVPPGHDGSPGKSDDAPGHTKSPSPSPSPSP